MLCCISSTWVSITSCINSYIDLVCHYWSQKYEGIVFEKSKQLLQVGYSRSLQVNISIAPSIKKAENQLQTQVWEQWWPEQERWGTIHREMTNMTWQPAIVSSREINYLPIIWRAQLKIIDKGKRNNHKFCCHWVEILGSIEILHG